MRVEARSLPSRWYDRFHRFSMICFRHLGTSISTGLNYQKPRRSTAEADEDEQEESYDDLT
jgi:hypothetical protein